MGDLIKVTTTVTLVTYVDKKTYFDGSEANKVLWDDDRIKRYIHQQDLQDHLEQFGEALQNVTDFEPKTTEREWGESYGDFSVTVQTEAPVPLGKETNALLTSTT